MKKIVMTKIFVKPNDQQVELVIYKVSTPVSGLIVCHKSSGILPLLRQETVFPNPQKNPLKAFNAKATSQVIQLQ
jgi:hypothetical protein